MPPRTLEELREELFKTLEGLRNNEAPLSIDRAKAISEVAQTFINSAKAEVEYLKVTGRQDDVKLPVFEPKEEQKQLPAGVVGVITHRTKS